MMAVNKFGIFSDPLLDRQIREIVHAVSKLEAHAGGRWSANTFKNERQSVLPTTYNGFYYKCGTQGGGTTGGLEPTWPVTLDGTITDGTVTWVCAGTFEEY